MKVANESKRAWFVNGVAYLFIVLFVYAAVSKLLDFETFRVQLAQSPLLSAYAGIIAWLVPGVEIMIALFLILPRFRNFALYASFFLMVMFTTYIYIILNFSDFVPCSCGGVLEKMSWTQHLIFNVGFILLAIIGVFLMNNLIRYNKFLILFILFIVGIGLVSSTFILSEKKIHTNNAFQRRYVPHPIDELRRYTLDYSTYYIAGIDGNNIYLGNYAAPLFLKSYSSSIEKITAITISISKTDLPYRMVKIAIAPPYFYLGDGTVPIIFKGSISNWIASPISFNQAYFSQFVIADSENIGFVTLSTQTRRKALGLFNKAANYDSIILNTSILKKDKDSPFESDGSLIWNDKYRQFLYTYYYRNSFEVSNNYLTHKYSGKTIDTIREPILHVAYSQKEKQYTLGGNSITINRLSATFESFLYINSDRYGKNENRKLEESASIIDVYNILDGTYVFSFYLYHQPGKKLLEFQVLKNKLIAIMENELIIYRLNPKFFNSGSNISHTAQYQE